MSKIKEDKKLRELQTAYIRYCKEQGYPTIAVSAEEMNGVLSVSYSGTFFEIFYCLTNFLNKFGGDFNEPNIWDMLYKYVNFSKEAPAATEFFNKYVGKLKV